MKLGVVTDVHLADPQHPPARFHNKYDFSRSRANFERALARHRGAGVSAIAILGDLANAGDDEHHSLGFALCEATGMPMWMVPGNHDCDEGATALSARLAASHSPSIRIPTPTGERHDGMRVAGLPTSMFDTERNWLVARPDVASWGSEPVLLLSHVPALSRAGAAAASGLNYAGDVTNHEEIATLLRARPAPTVVLHGHLHLRDAVVDGSVLQIGFASIIEPPHETATLEIDLDGGHLVVHVRHEAVANSTAERLPILSPATSTWRFAHGTWHSESPV